MKTLKYCEIKTSDKEKSNFIRRTRTVCIHASDRPKGIYSKNLVRIIVSYPTNDLAAEGVFCVDALGSKAGQLIGHPSHFKGIPNGSEVKVSILPATPGDCVKWLEGNDDPERKSLGKILNFALLGAEETNRLSAMSEENFKEAKRDRLIASQDKRKGIIYGIAGFLGGIIFDIGMIESKFGITIPTYIIIILTMIMLMSIFIALKRNEL